jgi:hypothetical protein
MIDEVLKEASDNSRTETLRFVASYIDAERHRQ